MQLKCLICKQQFENRNNENTLVKQSWGLILIDGFGKSLTFYVLPPISPAACECWSSASLPMPTWHTLQRGVAIRNREKDPEPGNQDFELWHRPLLAICPWEVVSPTCARTLQVIITLPPGEAQRITWDNVVKWLKLQRILLMTSQPYGSILAKSFFSIPCPGLLD